MSHVEVDERMIQECHKAQNKTHPSMRPHVFLDLEELLPASGTRFDEHSVWVQQYPETENASIYDTSYEKKALKKYSTQQISRTFGPFPPFAMWSTYTVSYIFAFQNLG
ncbi:unnamed protein product [Ectocarpus sp. 4 AP-2014]